MGKQIDQTTMSLLRLPCEKLYGQQPTSWTDIAPRTCSG